MPFREQSVYYEWSRRGVQNGKKRHQRGSSEVHVGEKQRCGRRGV